MRCLIQQYDSDRAVFLAFRGLVVFLAGDTPARRTVLLAVDWATRVADEPLLAAGVRIFEYQPRKLHARSTVVDADWAVVGSANFDYISLFVNRELVLVADDRHLVQDARETFERDFEDAREVSVTQRRRGLGKRALEGLGYIARRLLESDAAGICSSRSRRLWLFLINASAYRSPASTP